MTSTPPGTATVTLSSTPTVTTIATLSTPPTAHLPGKGTLVVNDSLSDAQHGQQWTVFTPSPYCLFTQGAYHVKVTKDASECDYKKTSFSNFDFQIQIRFVTDKTCSGIIFRKQSAPFTGLVTYYYFSICTDGSYGLNVVSNGGIDQRPALLNGVNLAIHQGVGQSNWVEIVANGNNLDFYVNGTKIDDVNDNTSSTGTIGVTVSNLNDPNGSGEVAFNDAKIWQL
jgi:hypothetical protein